MMILAQTFYGEESQAALSPFLEWARGASARADRIALDARHYIVSHLAIEGGNDWARASVELLDAPNPTLGSERRQP